MALSTASRGLMSDVLGWGAAAAIAIGGIVYAKELKDLAYAVLGVAPSVAVAPTAAPQHAATGTPAEPSSNAVELKVGPNGHFMADADINGRSIAVMVDTGASTIALTYEDADRIGVRPRSSDFTHVVRTANGNAKVAPVTLDRVAIGNVMVRNVQAVVIENGKLATTLLGNSFLSKLSRYEMRNGRLILEE